VKRHTASLVMAATLAMLVVWGSAAQADDDPPADILPLSTSKSFSETPAAAEPALSIAQQRARYAADMRQWRMETNRWIGYEPLRPMQPARLYSNELNHYYVQPVRVRPVWGVWNNGSRIW
jgi:hypothetical protein